MPQAPVQPHTRASSDVAMLVRLHHRRRGWAFVAAGSAIGLAVYAGIDVHLFARPTGATETLSLISVVVLLGLLLVGLADVVIDTSRIHRADAAARLSAQDSVSHYPLYAQAHRFPPRHPASWVAAIFMLAAMTCITGYILPSEVNSWAYVLGAEQHDTFNPVSYATVCAHMQRLGCQTVTVGYLTDTRAQVNWGTQVPLGQPFSVRDPLWAWGTGRGLVAGDGSAIPDIVAGVFFDGIALLLLYILVVIVRHTSPRRNQRMSVPAGADPGGVGRAHHPDGGHHGNAARSRARRRRGRR
jgi:hypothetical protein